MAFAHFSGLIRSALEKEAAAALLMVNNLLQDFHLQILSDKLHDLTFAKPQVLKNRPQTIRISGTNIH